MHRATSITKILIIIERIGTLINKRLEHDVVVRKVERRYYVCFHFNDYVYEIIRSK